MIATVRPSARSALHRALPWCVAGLAMVGGLLVARPYAVGVFHDDGAYAILARAIAEGRGFRFLQLAGEPAAIHYPPGYPLVLAAAWRAFPGFPRNVPALLALNAVFLGLAALGSHRLARGVLGWPSGASAIAAIAGTLGYPLLLLASALVSEPMFIAAVMLSLPALERAIGESPAMNVRESASGESWRRFVLVGVLCGGVTLIRTHGLALGAAVVLVLARRRRWRDAVWVALGTAIAVVPWQLWQGAHANDLAPALRGSYGSYVGWFLEGLGADGFIARTVSTNAHEIWSLAGGRFGFGLAAALALAGVMYGGWRSAARAPVTALFALIYMAIVMLWPYTPWRFVFAIWPLMILFLGEAARASASMPARFTGIPRTPAGALNGAMSVAAVVVAVGLAVAEGKAFRDRAWWQPAGVAAQQTVPALMWIVRETAEHDVIASEVPEMVYLYTGRRSVPVMPFKAAEYGVPRTTFLDAANLREVIAGLPVTHIVTIAPPLRDAAFTLAPPPVRLSDTTTTFTPFRVTR